MNLEPLSPQEGVTMYLDARKPEVAQTTLYEHKCRLKHWLEYCDQEDIDDMNTVTSRTAYSYRMDRQEEIAPTTLENEIRTFRLFIDFCESIDGVSDGVSNKIDVPTARKGERSREVKLGEDHAEAILDYLNKYEYASFRHVVFVLLWNTGMRTSGIRALDLEDYQPDVRGGPLLVLNNRVETGTPLKNRRFGEREVNLPDWVSEIISDYIDGNRDNVTDDYDRRPLVTTSHGRPTKGSFQRNIYTATRPCYIGEECPSGHNPEECEYTSYNKASSCPDSVSPHAMRRGSASYQLNLGMPEDQVCDRIDVTPEVLKEHYDARTTQERRELRRDWVDKM